MKSIIIILLIKITAGSRIESLNIIGGEYAEFGEFSYQASIQDDGRHICGGSIIDETTILTAAHCLRHAHIGQTKIYVGTVNRLSVQPGRNFTPQTFIYHNRYSGEDFRHDIGLIKLSETIYFNEITNAVELDDEYVIGEEALIFSGWGEDDSYDLSYMSNHLRFINLISIPNFKCPDKLGEYARYVGDDELCAIPSDEGFLCLGDSGGPLVRASNGKQVGINTWGRFCNPESAYVFTSISYFLDWINKHRNGTSNDGSDAVYLDNDVDETTEIETRDTTTTVYDSDMGSGFFDEYYDDDVSYFNDDEDESLGNTDWPKYDEDKTTENANWPKYDETQSDINVDNKFKEYLKYLISM